MLELMKQVYEESLVDPMVNARIQHVHIDILLKEGKHVEAYQAVLSSIRYNRQSGFHKELLV